MNTRYLLLGLIGAVMGAAAYLVVLSPTISLSHLTGLAAATLTPVWTWWTRLPTAVQTLIVGAAGAIPTLFFAWTKTRALQQLDQMKTQASTQITRLQGEKQALQHQLTANTASGFAGLVQERDAAVANADEAQRLLLTTQQQLRDLTNQHRGEVTALQNTIQDLKQKTVTVVK